MSRLGDLFGTDDGEYHPDLPADPDVGEVLLRVDGLTKHFPDTGALGGLHLDRDGDGPLPLSVEREWVRAVDDVTFDVKRGETLGLVGESGCGKSTLARTILRLVEPTDGAVYFRGRNLATLGTSALREVRQDVQLIFQDPQSSLNPRLSVGRIVEEPMRAHGMLDEAGREERARDLLEAVGLDPQHYNRYPHAFSGGQRQRINLARALSVEPDLIVCDEPVSALDVSIQAQVLNTMRDLQDEFGLTYVFIAHDLSVIRHISDRVAVMYLGKVVELAEKEELFENPRHPYTRALLDSIPVPDPRASGERGVLAGDVPSPVDPPAGCRFHTRCPALIAPDSVDLTDEEWDAVRRFARAVDRREFAATDAADIRERYFDGGFPRGEAGEVVKDAVAAIERDDWEDARSLLVGAFVAESVCAREDPEYETDPEYGDDRHFVACHLQRETDQTY